MNGWCLTTKEKNTFNKSLVEFSVGIDPFENARKKGVRQWIFAHIFNGTNKTFIIIVFITTIIAANLSSATMVYVGVAVNDFLNGLADMLFYDTLVIFLLGIGTPILRLFSLGLREILAQRLERDTRKEFYGNLIGKSQSFHDQQRIGELMARATDDVRMLNFFISPAVSLIFESFTALIVPLIYILLFYPPQLILVPIIFTVSFLIALRSYIQRLGPITGKLRNSFGRLDATLNEALTGIEVVKTTTQEGKEMQKYLAIAKEYKDAYAQEGVIQGKYLPILFLAFATTGGLIHSILLYMNGMLTVGQIISFLGLLGLLEFPTFISIFVFALVRLAISSSERLLEFMNKETEIDENLGGYENKIQGNIVFEDVFFKYPGTDVNVLKNVSFEAKPGQTIAIVGTTGSGKTTLTKLMSRLYDVSKGRILIDGIDIRKYALKSLRAQISYIEQDVFLFANSITYNISFGRVSSIEDVKHAAEQAQADQFISQLPEGFDTEVGERGVQLSGGERQRIAIARAFITNPQILILDDATSAIDSKTEDEIQKAISNILKNRTTILITHRLSQIRWADLILVLKSGELIASGTHEQLLKTSEEYRKIFVKKFDVDVTTLLKESA